MQVEIVDSSDPQNTLRRKPTASTIHERAADRAEGVLHGVARVDGLALCEACKLVLSPHMVESGILHDEVGREH